jgi:PAS domain S-box-containing protein
VKVTTEDGILLDMNAAGLAMIEADNLEQVIGQSVCPFVAPAHRDAFAEFTRRVYRGEPGTLQFELTGLKGTRRWMDTHAVPLHDEHNATIGVLAITRDITERKRTEQALRESEAQIRLFMEATADCIWNWDVTGARVTRNSGFERLFGYAAEEIIPTIEWWAERLHPDDRERVWITYGEAVASGRTTCSYEYRFRRRDGSYAVVSDHALMVRDGAGNVVRALGAMTDISARKQAEESLRDSERRFRTIFDQAPLGIAVINSGTGQFRRVNQKYCDIVGYADKDMLACTFQDITHPDDLQADLDNMQRLMEGRIHTFQMEKRYIRKDGTIVWVNLTCVPLWWDHERDNRFHIAMVEDITERRRAEERLARINECFLGFGVDPGKNINRVTALCGELLGAACALYNHLDGPMLHAVGQWQAPPGFNPVDLAAGHICHDVIQQGGTQPMTVRRLSETSYARTDPNVLPYKLQTYVGMPVKCQNTTVGSLCAVFQRDYVPSEADTKLLGILAAAIGVEEERRLAEEDQKRLLAQLAESRNRFEMFFRETPSAISITTVREGRFLDVNKQAEVLTGYAREELIGRTTVEMNLYVDPAERADIVRKLQETGVLTNLERQIRTKSGEVRTAVFSLVPIMMGADPCLLSIAHDITERKRAEEGLRERSRQQAIEAELSLLAITAQDLPGLLITAVKLVSNALDVDYCEALELLPNGTELRLCASAGWRGDQIGQVKTMRTGSLPHAALHSDQPVIIQDIRSGTRFSGPPWLREHGTVSGMSVTIRGREIPWGLLSVYAAGARNFSHDDINFLQTVSSILATAIERMQAESVLRGANQALRLLSSQLLQVQEDDRRAIARDLHDEIGQSLTAIKLNVERAQRTTDRDTRSRIMRDCVQITERVLGQVRDLSLDLHPSILDDLGLAHALKWYADRQAERAGLKVDVAADASLPRLPQEVEIACFRIAQEALTNVVRHARAGQARITLKRGASAVELCIQDDGIGFVVDAVSSPVNGVASVGLTGMQERAKLLSGTVRIASAPRCGTKVIATLPLHLAGRPTEEAPRS